MKILIYSELIKMNKPIVIVECVEKTAKVCNYSTLSH